ncbi:MAG TPA: SUMF1/EgtB/PvdO family nonheme iron enzyme [Rhodanobacteraceae bacterium]|nr:SUMF1/EgtB/PvdO family nonheme iron enzyme [Rhodanobacteraceae bacterium]
MPESQTFNRQRQIGAAAGVLLLAFALAYRFFPDALHVQHSPQASAGLAAGAGGQPMGFDQRPRRGAASPAQAGPPISMAPSSVILARIRSRDAGAGGHGAPISEQVADWLKQADAALDKGRLIGGDDSAKALYAKVLASLPDNRAARAGMVSVARQLALRAQKALAHGDDQAARTILAQLKQVPDADAEVAEVEKRLKIHDKAAPLLAHAADLLKRGHALAPASDNALGVYQQVMDIDPHNAVARAGLLRIQRQVLDKALAAVAQNDYATADTALAQAAAIAPDSQELQDTRSRIEGMRRQQAEHVLAQARSALDGGDHALARKLADKALAISPDLPGVDEFNLRLRNATLYASYQPGQVFHDRFLDRAGQAPAMVVVPTGEFMMGSRDGVPGHRANEAPQHQVTIAFGFAIGRTEVTVGQFREFVNATKYVTDAKRLGSASVYDERTGRMHNVDGVDWSDDYAGHEADDKDPVVNVSWNDARAYVRWLAQRTGKPYRLPSEAEFEYAMRAGTTSLYWWGNGVPDATVENTTGARDLSDTGRRWSNAFRGYRDGYWGPAPVMSFKPNPFGLYDIDGNVSEWVADCWHDNYTRATHDGSAWVNPGCAAHVVRGGSWGSAPQQERSAYRQPADAATRSGRVGFRVARGL